MFILLIHVTLQNTLKVEIYFREGVWVGSLHASGEYIYERQAQQTLNEAMNMDSLLGRLRLRMDHAVRSNFRGLSKNLP